MVDSSVVKWESPTGKTRWQPRLPDGRALYLRVTPFGDLRAWISPDEPALRGEFSPHRPALFRSKSRALHEADSGARNEARQAARDQLKAQNTFQRAEPS
ncbi:hypothetical protein GCM10022240_30140 [Microbacterium kribbense]|uniref:Uncharacterized protein n=1 Tax=Microbacterium kribbense TaxID=433645 RepID=A0ABP7H2M5_9MICO